MPWGDKLSFNVAYGSVMPRPENALISGNCACSAGSKLEASTTSNCSICPLTLGREMMVEWLVPLLMTRNNSFCKGALFKSNNLNSVGNESLATAFSVVMRAASVCEDHYVCPKTTEPQQNRVVE